MLLLRSNDTTNPTKRQYRMSFLLLKRVLRKMDDFQHSYGENEDSLANLISHLVDNSSFRLYDVLLKCN